MGNGFLQAVGGLGMFLLGMVVMTEGLRELAGETLQRVLARFTKSPASGAATGAATTAVIQSSSATSVAAIGFVDAGLLTFPQALGILFGANIGTTITGWLVALLGFKLNLGTLVMPLALVGVLMYLFTKGRTRHAGIALAGFALIFVGIDLMQAGMAGLEGTVTPETFPADTWGGRLLLVGIGILITLVTQSSSAGVATAITAVSMGAISFPQAAALVIGFDVGSTFTAVLATIGGSVSARRTGFSHVIYNLMTGTGAYLLLPVYPWALDKLLPGAIQSDPELALVGFHTFFNAIGIIAVIPAAHAFARLIIRLVPERGPVLTRRLNDTLVSQPAIAMQAATTTLFEIIEHVMAVLPRLLSNGHSTETPPPDLVQAANALQEVDIYLDKVVTSPEQGQVHQQHVSALHLSDHLKRIVHRCQDPEAIKVIRSDDELAAIAGDVAASADRIRGWLRETREPTPVDDLESSWEDLAALTGPYRERIAIRVASDDIGHEDASYRLEGFRWLRRVLFHLWRIARRTDVLRRGVLTTAKRQ